MRINEDIKGKGIPKGYPEKVKRRAKQRLNLPDDGGGFFGRREPSQTEMELGQRIMRLSQEVIRRCRGKEKQLESLASAVIKSNFADIIKRHKIRFDIKLTDSREVYRNLNESVEDETFKKRITNLITQGEAKNTKRLLYTEQVRDGLREIFRTGWEEMLNLFIELIETADKLDWAANPEIRARMMEQHPEFFAGSVRVIFDKDVNESKSSKGVLIKAYGVDFTMLLHEAVKGIFQVLSTGAIPADRSVAREVMNRTGLNTEPEDWQYGPEIAADLRDFINENSKTDLFPNVRLEVYRIMVDKRTMPTDEFLKFMEGILDNTKEAREKMDKIIDKVIKGLTAESENISNIKNYEKQMKDFAKRQKDYEKEMEEYNRQLEEYERKMKEYEEQNKKAKELDDILLTKSEEEAEDDYSKYSQSQLQSVLNRALDSADYETVRKVSPYLKESKKYNLR
ncbi:hypothetical protein EBU94_03155 [bacterium]|nr:hypothetical protein [bacterium]